MARWQRIDDGRDRIKLSIEIKRDQYPDLFHWLNSLPYGQTSGKVREILATAAQNAAQRTRTEARPADPPPEEPPHAPTPQMDTAPAAPHAAPSMPSSKELSDEVARLILEMNPDF